MNKIVLWNGVMNVILAVVFVMLNSRAARAGLEETFVSLALFYGVIVVVGNALYISFYCKK
jgi:hypothetical protein